MENLVVQQLDNDLLLHRSKKSKKILAKIVSSARGI